MSNTKLELSDHQQHLLHRWMAAWTWVEGCAGLEIYVGQTGITLKKFGIEVFASNIVDAVALALGEGWGYE